jgi:RHS repeat-associated protein
VTDAWGAVLETHDYYPFGEEVVDLGDNNKPKFTGYYRDSETKMDYALNRYDNSSIGRFLTPDPYMAGNAQNKPQLWNKYVYVGNDPINFIDRTGKDSCVWVPIPNSDGMEEEICFYEPGLLQVGNDSGPGHPGRSGGGSRIQFKNCEGEKGRAIVKDIKFAWQLQRLAINENPSPLEKAGALAVWCVRKIIESDGQVPDHPFVSHVPGYGGGPLVFKCTGSDGYGGESNYWSKEIRIGDPTYYNGAWHVIADSYTDDRKFVDAAHLILHEILHICSFLSEKEIDEIVDQYFPPFGIPGLR